MTLIISAVNEKGVWQISDRRLVNLNPYKVVTDSATKMIRLDLTDGKAIIGYAGVGSVGDTEISEWLKRLFRGQKMSYREARNLLAASATRRISPRTRTAHEFSIASIVNGRPKFEVVAADWPGTLWRGGDTPKGNFGSWTPSQQIRHCVYFSGSGRSALTRKDQRIAVRTLKRSILQADQLEAALVHLHRVAYRKLKTKTISSDCICTHIDVDGGGWSHLHSSTEKKTITIPTISGGLPVDDIAKALMEVEGPELVAALREKRKPRSKTQEVQQALKTIDLTKDDSLP